VRRNQLFDAAIVAWGHGIPLGLGGYRRTFPHVEFRFYAEFHQLLGILPQNFRVLHVLHMLRNVRFCFGAKTLRAAPFSHHLRSLITT
jgi:hypothetical protein